jgi:hypothetical protein
VSDSTTSAIDRVFDLVDNGVEKIDRVLNRAKYTEEQHRSGRAKRPEVIDTAGAEPARAPAPARAAATSTGIAVRRFRIVEAIVPESGATIFVVTNGTQRAECTTRELAEKILGMLEAAP